MSSPQQRISFVPKNRGLWDHARAQTGLTGPQFAKAISVRAEDIPYLASEAAGRAMTVTALTGEDLLAEWIAAGNQLHSRLHSERVAWSSRDALFGRPALCLVGRRESSLATARRVAICAKYRNLGDRYLDRVSRGARSFERIALTGALEELCALEFVDFVVDIVVTGASIRKAGLYVHDVVYASDLVLLRTE